MLHSNTICEEGEKSTGSATRAHPSRAAPSHPAGQHVTICGAESMGAGVDDTFLKARSVLFSSKHPSQPLPPKHQRRQHKAKHTGFGLLGAGAKQQFSASRKHPCILLDPWLEEPSKGRAHLECATSCPQHGQLAWLQSAGWGKEDFSQQKRHPQPCTGTSLHTWAWGSLQHGTGMPSHRHRQPGPGGDALQTSADPQL